MSASISLQDNNILKLTGDLNFSSVASLSDQGMKQVADGLAHVIDLQEVSHSDSAGLAMLLAWSQAAQQHQVPLAYINVPTQVIRLAEVTGVSEYLGLDDSRVNG